MQKEIKSGGGTKQINITVLVSIECGYMYFSVRKKVQGGWVHLNSLRPVEARGQKKGL